MPDPEWVKSPPGLVDVFSAEVAVRPELTARKMFGYAAAFLGGNLTTSLFRDGWVVRLGPADRDALFALGGQPFAPMEGRPMKDYVVLPRAIVEDPEERARWIDRAVMFVRALPPKA